MDLILPENNTPVEFPAVIIPEPFSLAKQSKTDLDKIRDEVMDKVTTWENRFTNFFAEYGEYADAYRMFPRKIQKKQESISSCRSGETHRATETLATTWLRMLTAQDPFFEAVPEGLDAFGREISPDELYSTEAVIRKQLNKLHFKQKLYRGLTSLGLFGSMIAEQPWVQLPAGGNQKVFEGTDLVHRSLLMTGFDPYVYDIEMSDYVFTVDYLTIWKLRALAATDTELWNREEIDRIFRELKDKNQVNSSNAKTDAYSRLTNRKQRAGYNLSDANVLENVNYHGKLDPENPVIQAYWESFGDGSDPSFSDFTVGILNGDGIVRFHETHHKSWHSVFKVAHYKLFELEPIGYGVGRTGRNMQAELDTVESSALDIVRMSLLSMWKVGRFAGLKPNQLTLKPMNIIELEDISQLEPLRPDINAVVQALAILAGKREDFRTTVGAPSQMQAILTKASATESSIAQAEGIRGGSVHAEIIAETFLREILETMHQNNLEFLDSDIWVSATGNAKPAYFNRYNLPVPVGFEIKTTTDKDFRPERLAKILEGINMSTSIRNVVPASLNVVEPLYEEWFRAMGMNPRLLRKPVPVLQQMLDSLQRAQKSGAVPQLMNELDGEQAGEMAGSGANVSTPVGDVPTSPIASRSVQLGAA